MTAGAASVPALDLQQAARDHLWLHFTRMSGYASADVPIIVRGDGCYLEDTNGKRYLDALAGLFSVNIGYGYGEEVGQAALEQMRELPFYTTWSYAHPRAVELAAEVASLAPGDLNRVFFVSGGSEAVESAWKLARQYYQARHEQRVHAVRVMPPHADAEAGHEALVAASAAPTHRYKAIARRLAYHGTTMGALSLNGVPPIRQPFEPLVPEVRHVHNTNRYHRPVDETEEQFTAFLLDELEHTIQAMGPETVCLVHMEPVQSTGGCLTPPVGYFQGVREICDRYDILLSADEVITAFGRLGYWFGSERYDIRPDLITSAKGLSSSYAAIGAVIATDRVFEPFLAASSMFSHGITFGGHPVMCAIALKNIEIMKRERMIEGVREHEDAFRRTLGQLLDLPIVGDVRGAGFFYAVELVKDKETRETFSADECEWLLRGFLSHRLLECGLICRADDRGDPVIQLSPPLIARQGEFDEIVRILGDVLTEAWGELRPEVSVRPGDRPAWWLEEAPPDPAAPALEGDVDVDVAIVGGGLTGLSTSLALKEREPALDVAILEAEFCGFGPSGRNGGFLESLWPALGRLRERLGDAGALEVARASTGVFAAVRALGEDVWLEEGGMLRISAGPDQDASLDAPVEAARALGVPEEARRLTEEEVAGRCRSPRFRSGVFFPSVGTVQPARLVRALRRAALARGVRVYEATLATAIRPGLVETPRGRARAREIVVATNAWMTGWRPASRRLTNFGSYVVLTEPVPGRLAELGWTKGEAIVDGRMFLHYFRTTADGRVLMGSASGPIGFGGRVDRRFTHDVPTVRRAEAALRRLLPGLEGARIEHTWGGPIDVSSDHLPFFGTVPGARIHFGAGYSGNGVGPSWLGGQILASLACGSDDEWSRSPLATRQVPSFPPEPLKRLGGGLVRWGILSLEEAEDAGRRPPPGARAVASLPRRFGMRIGTR